MPPNLSVPVEGAFTLSVVLKDAAAVMQTILKMQTTPKFTLTIPPGVKRQVPDPEGQILGSGFSGIYIGLEGGKVLAEIGVIDKSSREPPSAYFAGGRSRESKALVAALAIAVAELVGSNIADYSGHWMPQDTFTAGDLLRAMTSSSAFDNCVKWP